MRSKETDQLLNQLVIQYQQEKNEDKKNDIFNQVYKSYKVKFDRLAFKFHNEDLTQELSIALLKAMDTYNSDMLVKFNTYFWKIAQNYIGLIMYYNSAAKRLPTAPLIYLDQPINIDNAHDTASLCDIIEDEKCSNEQKDLEFYIFLETDIFINLSVVQITIIKLYLNGYTMTEIAHLLGTNTSGIQNKVRSIRQNKKVYKKFTEYFDRENLIQIKPNTRPIYSTEWVKKLIEEKSVVKETKV